MKSSYDIIVWIFIFLLIALIIGLYISENKRIPPSLYTRTNGASTPYIEHFEQKSSNIDGYRNSSSFDVSGGASSKYGWGINEYENDYERNQFKEDKKEDGEEVKKCISKKNDPMCTKDYIEEKNKESCYKCDILQHPEIDKYVLKSSVPACPNIDLNDYIKKSEIPACPNINLNDYIKKSEVPVPKVCPTIEKCPTCPEIPSNLKPKSELKNNYQFNILDVKHLSNEDLKLLFKDERIKNYLDSEYEKKNNIPQPNSQSQTQSQTQTQSKTQSQTQSKTQSQSQSQSKLNSNIEEKEEESLHNINYNSSSSLWDEIKGLFGFSKNNVAQEEELKKISKLQEEEYNKNKETKNNKETKMNHISNLSNMILNKINKTEEEEENKMIYNKKIVNQNFFKQDQSNAMAMYAGDSLYASV